MARTGRSITLDSRARLLRGPLFWAAVAAFVGAGIGLLGTLRRAAFGGSFYVDPTAQLLAQVQGALGEALVASSSLGVVYLVWNALRGAGRRLALMGAALLALLLTAEGVGIASAVYWSRGTSWQGYAAFPFPALEAAASLAVLALPSAVLLIFTALALAAREKGLAGLLFALFLLSVPIGTIRFLFFTPDPATMFGPGPGLVASLLGWYSAELSLLEAPLWVLLGAMFLRRARGSALVEASRVREKENLEAARRLYEEGLGRGDASVVDELVAEDFRDLKRGVRGKPGMGRVFSALRKSYPDLAVSIERQEAEGDLVTTRLTLSGTDGGGVLWYPPTGRRATFTAEFVDRFSDGELIEHSGQADTAGLLRQLGLAETHVAPPPGIP
ncbi:MAG: Permease of the drug/metabolite transporter (DMT) superfamily [uncultured Rubrobacteraceae bacterium]|uniref:Permease of the drug/metabolite transporter (DMT) superfamily n=1 Tax=uncultured Rubrobacteraceae bacterium TaxID=349277 RepID=A0A6J4R111_9ACTN|nr:MAG: Permease of the drug/metabolite transporter (DMT) superfamily [uncultured Rubrobacteraceae bacterium]